MNGLLLVRDVIGDAPTANEDRQDITEVSMAGLFIMQHGHEVRWCREMGCWLVWTGKRWHCDADGLVTRWAIEVGRSLYAEASKIDRDSERDAFNTTVKRTQTKRYISAMLALARDLEGVTVSSAELDADPYLLNVANGIVDLRSGELLTHDPAHLLTRLIPHPYHPDATAPRWTAFLERVQPNPDTRDFLQRWAGYSATGETNERMLAVFYGTGRNGKSTFRKVVDEIMEEYTRVAPAELLVGRKDGTIPTDLAGLKGKRSVSVSETEKGRPLASAIVKQMTGGDTVTARFMRQDFFDFVPTFKITLLTNHKPRVDGNDQAIWDRIALVLFGERITDEELDRELRQKLKREYAGILTYIVRGAVKWYQHGLGSAPEIQAATKEYRAESDTVGGFMDAACVLGASMSVPSSVLHSSYKLWCASEEKDTLGLSDFTAALMARGHDKPARASGGAYKGSNVWRGIALAEVPQT